MCQAIYSQDFQHLKSKKYLFSFKFDLFPFKTQLCQRRQTKNMSQGHFSRKRTKKFEQVPQEPREEPANVRYLSIILVLFIFFRKEEKKILLPQKHQVTLLLKVLINPVLRTKSKTHHKMLYNPQPENQLVLKKQL